MSSAAVAHDLFRRGGGCATVLDGDDCAAFDVTEEELTMVLEVDGRLHLLRVQFTEEERSFARAMMKFLQRAS